MQSVVVPDVLRGEWREAERLLVGLSRVDPADGVQLDLSAVTWVRPYGSVILLVCCQSLAQSSGKPVVLSGLSRDVGGYLREASRDPGGDTLSGARNLPARFRFQESHRRAESPVG